MADGTITDAARAVLAPLGPQRAVPSLDVLGTELLQQPCSQERGELVLDELLVALGSLGRDCSRGFPLSNASANVIANGELAGLDVAAISHLRQQAGELDLRFTAATLE